MADDVQTRKLATIVALDVAGYSARTEADEARTTTEVAALGKVIEGIASRHGGRVFNTAGDGFMLEFSSSLAAVEAAFDLAETCEPKVRVGVHVGDVVVQPNGDLLGHGVNVAARLMAKADPGSSLISADVKRMIRGPIAERLQSRGQLKLDKMAETIEAFAFVAITAAIVAAQPRTTPPPPATPDTFSIALAPFADPTGGATGDDFADGLVAEIATALTRFPVLRVADAGPASVARYLLEGSVRRSGPSVRINVQLREAARGERVWAERFDSGLVDPFALQDDVANKVAGRIEAAILAHETRRIAARPVESLSAHELSLRARETIRRAGLEQVDEIEALSERAVVLDPSHAPSLAFLATALGFRISFADAGTDLAALRDRLGHTIDRAMLFGSEDPEVLAFVAEALLLADKDMVVARALVDRALQMNPGLVVGWDISGNIRLQGGEYKEALALYERCLYLDPKSPWRTYVWPSMAGCLVAMGRFDEAIALAKEGLQIGPNNPWGAANLIAALAHSGRIGEARAALAQFDPRQAGVFETSAFGPKLTAMIQEALTLAGWTGRRPS